MVLKAYVVEEMRRLRHEEHLSIRDIGKTLHISPTTVSKYLHDKDQVASRYRENSRVHTSERITKQEEMSAEDKMYTFLEKMYKFDLLCLRLRLERKRLQEPPAAEQPVEEKKYPLVVDGILLHLNAHDLLEWKKYQLERESAREERELRMRRTIYEEENWGMSNEKKDEETWRRMLDNEFEMT